MSDLEQTNQTATREDDQAISDLALDQAETEAVTGGHCATGQHFKEATIVVR